MAREKRSFNEERFIEAQRLAFEKERKCIALFELPREMYAQSKKDDATRNRPLRLSYSYCEKVVQDLVKSGRLK